MKEYLRDIRDQKMYEVWEEHKNRLTMQEVAEMFNCELQTTYKIIAKVKKDNK